MPALLTAIVITCGALKGPSMPLICRAQIYHGAYTELATCTQTAQELAIEFERNVVAMGSLTRTKSYGECVSAADDADVVDYLPKFMTQTMGAASSVIAHYDLIDGVAVERIQGKPAKKAVKRASI